MNNEQPRSRAMQKALVCWKKIQQSCQMLYFFARKHTKGHEISQKCACNNLDTSITVN